MFLKNELVVDDTTSKQMSKRERNACEMKPNKPTTELWTVLAMVNVLALIYPINLLLRANSLDENFFATCVLVGLLLLLVAVDGVSIVVAEAAGAGKH